VLLGAPAVATTKVEEDVDGGPLGVLPRAPAAATTEVEEDVDGGAPGGAALVLHCSTQWLLQKRC
jgi:hypothetical protein